MQLLKAVASAEGFLSDTPYALAELDTSEASVVGEGSLADLFERVGEDDLAERGIRKSKVGNAGKAIAEIDLGELRAAVERSCAYRPQAVGEANSGKLLLVEERARA